MRIALLAAALLLAACPAPPPELPADTASFWVGTVQERKATGEAVGDPLSFALRRDVLPASSRIDERWVEGLGAGEAGVEYVVQATVAAEDATVQVAWEDAHGAAAGTGALLGDDAWRWLGWQWTTSYASGDRLDDTLLVDGAIDGALSVDRELRAEGGDVRARFEVRGASVDEAGWDAARLDVLAGD